MASAAHPAPLLERDAELRILEDTVSLAAGGTGAVALVEAAAGTGKSRLVEEAAALATNAGMDVVRARGDEHEREFPFGVALQLLESRVRRADPAERTELFSGAAGVARSLFETGSESPGTRDPSEVLRLVHGLFWVVQNLAERRPVGLLVDDAHWADVPSLRFLRYLANRIGDLHVALVAAYRDDRKPLEETPLGALAAIPSARVLRPRPLSDEAVTTLVRVRLPEASDAFCEACAEATGGNPFYLEELLRTVAAEDVPPGDDGAEQVRTLVPEAVETLERSQSTLLAPGAGPRRTALGGVAR